MNLSRRLLRTVLPTGDFLQHLHLPHFHNFRGDLFGGVTAAVVALPLALAFGVSSGLGPAAGLYGAIFIGFFAALFGGTPSQISGPTGPMTVTLAAVLAGTSTGDATNGVALAFTIVTLGGLLQILFGVLHLGKYITLIPYTVISGFMSGIGAIILAIELGPFFGHPVSANVVESLRSFPMFVREANLPATAISLLTLAIVFGLPKRWSRIVPAPLVALIVGTIVSLVLFPIEAMPRIGAIPVGLPTLQAPDFSFLTSPAQLKLILGYSLMLAVLGAIDSLLTSLVADNLTQTQHDSDRELVGQGIGNAISGLFGGLPGAGATMRTAINVKAGGRTPLSGMIHAIVLLAVVLGAAKLTAPIPHAVLAGILIKVGLDIIDWSFLKRAHRISRKAAALMYTVLLLTVFVDLITAVAIGIFIANMLTVESLTKLQMEHLTETDRAGSRVLTAEEDEILQLANHRILLFHLSGAMSFGAAKGIAQRLPIVGNYEVLVLDISDVPRIGVTASLAIENMVKEAASKNRSVFVVGATGTVKTRLSRLDVFDLVPPDSLLLTRREVLERALAIVRAA